MNRLSARLLLGPIRFYQRFLSPLSPGTCRYYPTCSAYAVEALQVHGALRGSWLTIRRLGRCHPWSKREHVDLVPEPRPGRRDPHREHVDLMPEPRPGRRDSGARAGEPDTGHGRSHSGALAAGQGGPLATAVPQPRQASTAGPAASLSTTVTGSATAGTAPGSRSL